MKILCPVDFSVTSVDAVYYALAFSSRYADREIELIHCIFSGLRSTLFPSYTDFVKEKAEADLDRLIEEIKRDHSNFKLTKKILKGDPIVLLPSYIADHGFQYVVIGTKGLSAAKSNILGSVTEELFENTDCPIIAVPQGYVFHRLKNVVLAIDSEVISSDKVVRPFLDMIEPDQSRLKLLHVRQEGDTRLEIDLDLEAYIDGIDYDYYSKYTSGSVNKAINDVCLQVDADLLCLIHRDRGWMLQVFHRSQVREELLHLGIPVLVLHD